MLVLVTSELAILLCITAAGDVATARLELWKPSPAELDALTRKRYVLPPSRPVALHDVANASPPHATAIVTADGPHEADGVGCLQHTLDAARGRRAS